MSQFDKLSQSTLPTYLKDRKCRACCQLSGPVQSRSSWARRQASDCRAVGCSRSSLGRMATEHGGHTHCSSPTRPAARRQQVTIRGGPSRPCSIACQRVEHHGVRAGQEACRSRPDRRGLGRAESSVASHSRGTLDDDGLGDSRPPCSHDMADTQLSHGPQRGRSRGDCDGRQSFGSGKRERRGGGGLGC